MLSQGSRQQVLDGNVRLLVECIAPKCDDLSLGAGGERVKDRAGGALRAGLIATTCRGMEKAVYRLYTPPYGGVSQWASSSRAGVPPPRPWGVLEAELVGRRNCSSSSSS
jgi:hypothetical protein